MKNKLRLSNFLLLLFLLSINHLKAQKIFRPLVVNFLEAAKYDKTHPRHEAIDGEVHERNMQPVPMYLQTPSGARQTFPATNNQSRILNPVTNNPLNINGSPPPNTTFVGATDNNTSIPPDGGGAVGPSHVFSAENHVFVIRTKAGVVVSSVTPATFFSGLNPGFASDPHVKYDQYSQRWIVIGQSDFNANSSLVIAVSQTNDPTGNYNKYAIRLDSSGVNAMDYPLIGYNKNWIVVSTNMFNLGGTTFTGTALFVFDKANLYSGGVVNLSTNGFRQLNTTTEGSVACPMTSFSTGAIADQFYLIQPWNASTGQLRLSQITGTLPALTWPANPVYPNLGAYGGGPTLTNIAPQAIEPRKINNGVDNRCYSFVERNGNLWGCNHVWVGTAPNDRTVGKWFELSPAGAILQNGYADPGGNAMAAFPSLAVTANEEVVIAYSRFSPTTFASAAYMYRSTATPANTLESEVVYHAGVANYYKDFGDPRNRWGDYSSTAIDPATGSVWTIQEIADTRVGPLENDSRYATWWAEILPVKRDALISGVVLSPGASLCYPTSVIATLKNGGNDILTTVSIGVKVDGIIVPPTYNFSGNLSPLNSQNIAVATINGLSAGLHTLKVYTFNPNGGTDQRPANDTLTTTFTVLPASALPLLQGFEGATFPPTSWQLYNPDGYATWQRTTTNFLTGTAAITIPSYHYSNPGTIDILETLPVIITGVDTLNITFDVSYAPFIGTSYLDTLEIIYSTDCGNTWQTTGYKKWGAFLGTSPAQSAEWLPTLASQWRGERINLPLAGISSSSLIVGIKWINLFGNDVYIDNFSVCYHKPKATFTINTATQCHGGNNFIFTNTTPTINGPVSYLWNFGDGTTSATVSPSHIYLATGNYTVKLVATGSQCTDSTTANVVVNNCGTYTFTGNGNWNTAANWQNNLVPPTTVAANMIITINPAPGGQCYYIGNVILQPGGQIIVNSGKAFNIRLQ